MIGNQEVKAETLENPQQERGEALAKAIAKKASRKTNQEQQDFCLGLLIELERRAGEVVEAGIREEDDNAA